MSRLSVTPPRQPTLSTFPEGANCSKCGTRSEEEELASKEFAVIWVRLSEYDFANRSALTRTFFQDSVLYIIMVKSDKSTAIRSMVEHNDMLTTLLIALLVWLCRIPKDAMTAQ